MRSKNATSVLCIRPAPKELNRSQMKLPSVRGYGLACAAKCMLQHFVKQTPNEFKASSDKSEFEASRNWVHKIRAVCHSLRDQRKNHKSWYSTEVALPLMTTLSWV